MSLPFLGRIHSFHTHTHTPHAHAHARAHAHAQTRARIAAGQGLCVPRYAPRAQAGGFNGLRDSTGPGRRLVEGERQCERR